MRIQSFRDLEAWQLGMGFAERVYQLTQAFPPEERYGLTAQLHRAAIAVPSNISEGHQQGSRAYLHYVVMAIGSLAEADTQLELAVRLKMAAGADVLPVIEFARRLRQVLHGLRRSLR